jgi:Zn-dependent protease/CBS domain-containing protein
MFQRSFSLFRLFGFAIRIHASWLVIAFVVTWSLAAGYFPYRYPSLTAPDYWWMAGIGALLLFASIVVHELSHAMVARRFDVPMKGITLFVFGGIAEMDDEMPSAKSEFLMAAAGPVASVLIGGFFYALYRLSSGQWPLQAVGILEYLYWINLVLAGFNLIPAFPLDGGRIFRAALWAWKNDLQWATRAATSVGSVFGIVLACLGVLQLFAGNFITAIWWFMLGMLLRSLSQAAYSQTLLKTTLSGEPVSRFMRANPVTVTPGTSIEELVNEHVYKEHERLFPVVTASNVLAGCVSADQVKNVPRHEWPQHSVQEILKPCSPENTITPETDSVEALKLMNRSGTPRLMVVEGRRLVAVVALKDILNFLSARLELEGRSPRRAA